MPQLRYTDEHGKEVRVSAGSRDDAEVEKARAELEAKLVLGVNTRRRGGVTNGSAMPWEMFREEYRQCKLATLRVKSAEDAESRLDIAERIIKPRTLGDVNCSDALAELQRELLAGAEGRRNVGKPRAQWVGRSPWSVNGYVKAVLAALNWAHRPKGWLPSAATIDALPVDRNDGMKGRPVEPDEFEAMLDAVEAVVGKRAAESWQRVLRCMWESGLRLAEVMAMHWTDPKCIRPVWLRGADPVIAIPGGRQKNRTTEHIPMLPGLEALLAEVPEVDRTGWVFDPRARRHRDRLSAEWVGRVITKIGKRAGVVVNVEGKFGSAHDLRRGFAGRLVEAGVAPADLQEVMRHADPKTTQRFYVGKKVQRTSRRIRERLATVPVQ